MARGYAAAVPFWLRVYKMLLAPSLLVLLLLLLLLLLLQGHSRSWRHMNAAVVLQLASAQPQALGAECALAYAWLALASAHSSGCCRSFGSGSGGEVVSG